MRQQSAIVAVIQDGDGRFLVTFSAKWGGYAVPMIAVPDADTGSRSVSRLSNSAIDLFPVEGRTEGVVGLRDGVGGEAEFAQRRRRGVRVPRLNRRP